MGKSFVQVVDPQVSRKKFEKELENFKKIEEFNRNRGVIMLSSGFPQVVLAFIAFRVRPAAIAFAVQIDFTNYDLEPPSIQFVDPLTGGPLRADELNIQLLKKVGNPKPDALLPNGQIKKTQEVTNLIQAHQPYNVPFLCIPGVREYHEHPAHSNNPWLPYRGYGEGTLGFIVDQLYKYGTEPITGCVPHTAAISQPAPSVMQVVFQGFTFSIDLNLISS